MRNPFSIFFDNGQPDKRSIFPKICCVFFAVIIWLSVVGQNPDIQHEMTYYAVPVNINNAALLSENSGLSIISGYDYNINITVRGNRAKLSNYSSEDIVAFADVGGITEAGEHDLRVTVSLPPSSGFTIVSQSLDTVSVSVDKLTSIELDVNVNIVNAQYNTDSYALGAATVSPEKVTVKGPQKLLDSISSANVNLDLGNVTSNIGFNNRIVLIDSNGEEIDSPYISLSNLYAEGNVPFISIEEAQKIVEKSVPLVYNFKYGYLNASNSTVSISPQFVTLSGYENELNKIQSLKIITIDDTKVGTSTVLTVPIDAPNGTTLVNSKRSATVSIRINDDLSSAAFDLTDLICVGIGDGFTASLSRPLVLTMRGDSQTLAQMQALHLLGEKLFEASVDVGLITDVGEYKLPVSVFVTDPRFKNIWCEYSEAYINVKPFSNPVDTEPSVETEQVVS